MSMFDFEFDDYDGPAGEARLNELLEAYENSKSTYFDSDTLEDIANFYFEQGRYEDALGVVDRLLETLSFSSDAWMRRGILLNNLGRHDRSEERRVGNESDYRCTWY